MRKVGEVGMKKDFIVRRSITMVEGKPHVETYSEQELVHCKDCKHRPKEPNLETFENGFDIEFPEGSKCPCQCEYYSWYPEDDWYCANGERQDK